MSQGYYPQPNPYSPGYGYRPARRGPRLPGFCKGFVITDLVFCCIRTLLLVFSVIGAAMVERGNPLYPTVLWELVTGAGIVAFGLTGNILILSRKPAGVVFGWLNAASTAGNIGVAIWQGVIQMEAMESGGMISRSGSAPRLGFAMGAGMVIAVVIRVVLLVLYLVAVAQAQAAFSQTGPPQRPYENPPSYGPPTA